MTEFGITDLDHAQRVIESFGFLVTQLNEQSWVITDPQDDEDGYRTEGSREEIINDFINGFGCTFDDFNKAVAETRIGSGA